MLGIKIIKEALRENGLSDVQSGGITNHEHVNMLNFVIWRPQIHTCSPSNGMFYAQIWICVNESQKMTTKIQKGLKDGPRKLERLKR